MKTLNLRNQFIAFSVPLAPPPFGALLRPYLPPPGAGGMVGYFRGTGTFKFAMKMHSFCFVFNSLGAVLRKYFSEYVLFFIRLGLTYVKRSLHTSCGNMSYDV